MLIDVVRLDDAFWCDELPNFSHESSWALSSNSWNNDRRTESNFFDIFLNVFIVLRGVFTMQETSKAKQSKTNTINEENTQNGMK